LSVVVYHLIEKKSHCDKITLVKNQHKEQDIRMVDDTRVHNVVTFEIPLPNDSESVMDVLDRPEQPAVAGASNGEVAGSGTTVKTGNISTPTTNKNRPPAIVAQEEDSDNEGKEEHDDVIPGPALPGQRLDSSGIIKPSNSNVMDQSSNSRSSLGDSTEHYGSAMHSTLASRRDINMDPNEFALGCKLLQAAALGNLKTMDDYLNARPKFINFRDYDRRTALHVAASEGHLEACKYLVQKGAKINRRYVALSVSSTTLCLIFISSGVF
jgi:hypothetical protein